MELTKKQVGAVVKLLKNNKTPHHQETLGRLNIKDKKMWATDGYTAVCWKTELCDGDIKLDELEKWYKLANTKSILDETAMDELRVQTEHAFPDMAKIAEGYHAGAQREIMFNAHFLDRIATIFGTDNIKLKMNEAENGALMVLSPDNPDVYALLMPVNKK